MHPIFTGTLGDLGLCCVLFVVVVERHLLSLLIPSNFRLRGLFYLIFVSILLEQNGL